MIHIQFDVRENKENTKWSTMLPPAIPWSLLPRSPCSLKRQIDYPSLWNVHGGRKTQMLAQVFLPLWPWVERVLSVPWSKSGPKSGLYNPHFVQTWGFSLPPYHPFHRTCKTWVKIKQETCNYHGGWLTLPRKNNNTLMSIEGFQWDSKTSITTQGFACSLVHAQWLWGKVRATIEQDTSFTCKLP